MQVKVVLQAIGRSLEGRSTVDEGDPDVEGSVVEGPYSRQDGQGDRVVGAVNVQVHVLAVVEATEGRNDIVLGLAVDDEFVDIALSGRGRLEVEGDKVQSDLAGSGRDARDGDGTGSGIVVRGRRVGVPEVGTIVEDGPSTRDLIDTAQAYRSPSGEVASSSCQGNVLQLSGREVAPRDGVDVALTDDPPAARSTLLRRRDTDSRPIEL